MNALKLALTVALGLAVRALTGGVFAKVAGDMLYAVAAFYAVSLVLRRHRALVALAYCVAIECLQLYHPPWLEALRATLFGRLVLGSVFSFYDLLSYAAGVALAVACEHVLFRVARPAVRHDELRATQRRRGSADESAARREGR